MKAKKTWEEFRKSGLLWFINTILHMFGWAIVIEYETYDKETETGKIKEVYPARVKYRGFEGDINDEGYLKTTKYLAKNIEQLLEEVDD